MSGVRIFKARDVHVESDVVLANDFSIAIENLRRGVEFEREMARGYK
jgi:hypothetical protein